MTLEIEDVVNGGVGGNEALGLFAPQAVKPYVKRGKNDAADAEALCEAMSRPTMRFVPVKTAEQQAAAPATIAKNVSRC